MSPGREIDSQGERPVKGIPDSESRAWPEGKGHPEMILDLGSGECQRETLLARLNLWHDPHSD